MNNAGGGSRCYLRRTDIEEIHEALSWWSVRNCIIGCPYSPLDPYIVSGHDTIDYDFEPWRDIIIDSNAALTISCTVRMPNNGKIIVNAGGKLIIDGGTITTACDSMWEGIIVKGEKTSKQYLSSTDNLTAASPYQGFLYARNATIENAHEAIRVWNPDDGWVDGNDSSAYGETGGIIRAEGTTFRNNRRSAEFMSYHYIVNGNSVPNKSYFKNCTFVLDTNYRTAIHPFAAHVSMWNVDAVNFDSCQFFNNDSRTTMFGSLGHGIYTIDAGYRVSNSIFKGFSHGIWANEAWKFSAVNVLRCTFDGNFKGLSLYNCNLSVIDSNIFKTGQTHVPYTTFEYIDPQDPIVGVEINGAQFSQFQRNAFEANEHIDSLYTIYTQGAWINNTGEATSASQDNQFANQPFGTGVNGANRSANNGATGLKLACNEHTGTGLFDFYVVGDNDTSTLDGIRNVQGDVNGPTSTSAGDQFNIVIYLGDTVQEGQYYNSASQNIGYYYKISNEDPGYYTTNTVTKILANNPATCDFDTIIAYCPGCMLSPTQVHNFEIQFNTHNGLYLNEADSLNHLIDGSNTAGLISQVGSATAADSTALKDTLLSYSPYLSGDVMKAVGKRPTIISDTVYLQLFKANPDLKNDAVFIDYLFTPTAGYSRPDWLKDSVNAAVPATGRTALQNDMSYHGDLMYAAYTPILRNIVNDTAGMNHDSLRYWLIKMNTDETKMMLARDLLSTAEFNAADTVIAALAAVSVPNNRLQQKGVNIGLLSMQARIMRSGRGLMQLTIAEQDTLLWANEVSALTGAKFAEGTKAGNILRSFYDNTDSLGNLRYGKYEENPVFPDISHGSHRMMRITNVNSTEQPKPQNFVKVYPNPATNLLYMAYSTIAATDDVQITITDLTGRVLLQKKAKGGENVEIIHTDIWSSGSYIYEVKSISNRIGSGIFMISK